jgi:hypothetical protein
MFRVRKHSIQSPEVLKRHSLESGVRMSFPCHAFPRINNFHNRIELKSGTQGDQEKGNEHWTATQGIQLMMVLIYPQQLP